jgi:hypothetical protein
VLYVDDAAAAGVLDTLRLDEAAPTTTTTLPLDPTAVTAPSATTTTTAPVLPVSDQDLFGSPAEVTAPCG